MKIIEIDQEEDFKKLEWDWTKKYIIIYYLIILLFIVFLFFLWKYVLQNWLLQEYEIIRYIESFLH